MSRPAPPPLTIRRTAAGAPVLMVVGTSSHAGKTTVVAALCRWFADRGVDVAPFKAQNMSLNAAVTPDGAEIGRAQMLQARAARVTATAHMNPILLKPHTEQRSQVVVRGRPLATEDARAYFTRHHTLWPVVAESLDTLRASHELVIAEGAGSPAEINLYDRDLVNMKVARYANAPALLVGDIERGGVFASLYGTVALLPDEERALVRGFLINKFRGDPSLVDPGPAMLEHLTGIPTLGVVPWLRDVDLPEEDALGAAPPRVAPGEAALDVVVVRLPHLANFDDFDPLRRRPGVAVRFVGDPEEWGDPDLVIIPGSKTTMADLAWLRERQLDRRVLGHQARGGPLIGICGGFQMLGHRVSDPHHVESPLGEATGLGVLDAVTTFHPGKTTVQVHGVVRANHGLLQGAVGMPFEGYEIHAGESTIDQTRAPFAITRAGSDTAGDGAIDAAGWTLGTYQHGLLHNHELCECMLANVARLAGVTLPPPGHTPSLDDALDRLTAHVAAHTDMDAIASWVTADE